MTEMPEGTAPEEPLAPVEPPAPATPLIPPVAGVPFTAMPSGRPKTNAGFFVLGFFTPMVVAGLLTGIIGAVAYADTSGLIAQSVGIGSSALEILGFFGFLVAFVVGKRKENVKLWSFGKGGMWAYAAVAIIGLLAFGTCAVFLNGNAGA